MKTMTVVLIAIFSLCAFAQGQVQNECSWNDAQFDFGSSTPVDELNQLGILGNALAQHPKYRVRLVGHADIIGDDQTNYRLGLARAESVRNLLIGGGARAEQFTIESRGKTNGPAGQSSVLTRTDTKRWEARRVEITLTDGQGVQLDQCQVIQAPVASKLEITKQALQEAQSQERAKLTEAQVTKALAEADLVKAQTELLKAQAEATRATATSQGQMAQADAKKIEAEAKLITAQAQMVLIEVSLAPQKTQVQSDLIAAQVKLTNRMEKYPKISAASGLIRSVVGFGGIGTPIAAALLRPAEYNSTISNNSTGGTQQQTGGSQTSTLTGGNSSSTGGNVSGSGNSSNTNVAGGGQGGQGGIGLGGDGGQGGVGVGGSSTAFGGQGGSSSSFAQGGDGGSGYGFGGSSNSNSQGGSSFANSNSNSDANSNSNSYSNSNANGFGGTAIVDAPPAQIQVPVTVNAAFAPNGNASVVSGSGNGQGNTITPTGVNVDVSGKGNSAGVGISNPSVGNGNNVTVPSNNGHGKP